MQSTVHRGFKTAFTQALRTLLGVDQGMRQLHTDSHGRQHYWGPAHSCSPTFPFSLPSSKQNFFFSERQVHFYLWVGCRDVNFIECIFSKHRKKKVGELISVWFISTEWFIASKMVPGGRNHLLTLFGASLVAQMVKNPPAMQETWVQSLGWDDPVFLPGDVHGQRSLVYWPQNGTWRDK